MLKSIQQVFYATIMVCISLFIFNSGYAEEIDLPCCTGTECPTRYVSPGEPGVVQTATFKGISANGELLTMFIGDPGYKDWRREVFKMPGGQELIEIVRKARIYAHCSDSTDVVEMAKQKTLTCPEGDSITLDQDEPTCDDPKVGPHSIVEITRTRAKREENKNGDSSDVDEIIARSRARFDARQEEHTRLGEQIRLEEERFERLNQRILNSGFPKAFSTLSMGSKT